MESHCGPVTVTSAYMNHQIMMKWIERIYKAHLIADGFDPRRHASYSWTTWELTTHAEVAESFRQAHDLSVIYFPPNTTPILQPLDDAVNAEFKRLYEESGRVVS